MAGVCILYNLLWTNIDKQYNSCTYKVHQLILLCMSGMLMGLKAFTKSPSILYIMLYINAKGCTIIIKLYFVICDGHR